MLFFTAVFLYVEGVPLMGAGMEEHGTSQTHTNTHTHLRGGDMGGEFDNDMFSCADMI